MDVQALEQDALAAVAAATSTEDIGQVRIELLGRKSELKLALREVRDREAGMALNALKAARGCDRPERRSSGGQTSAAV